MKRKRRNTYLVSALTLALVFALVILIFRDALPGIGKNLRAVPLWGVLLLLALGFAYEAMESAVCLVIIHHKKPDCTLADALRVTFLGVFGNIATMGAGTLPMQSYCLYRRGLDAGSGLGIMASEYVLHKISVLLYATAALLLGGEWLRGGANGLARYILIGYAIGALIVLALTLIYTWDRVLALVLRLLDGLLHKPKWARAAKMGGEPYPTQPGGEESAARPVACRQRHCGKPCQALCALYDPLCCAETARLYGARL